MNCPRGCDSPLKLDKLVGIEIDRCVSCEGIWLDTGEGEIVTRPGEEIPQALLDQVDSSEAITETGVPLPCPRCEKPMARELFAKSGVEIDRCGCGVWLDKGELAKIHAFRLSALEDLREAHAGESYPAELYERAFSRFFFDLGTPPE